MDRESCPADKNDHYLPSHNDELDPDEEIIPLDPFEYVKPIIKPSVVILIEDLHPYKGVEYQSLHFIPLITCDLCARKIEDQCDNELVYRLADDHLPHGCGDQWS